MKSRYLAIGVAGAIAVGAVPALADHNSKNGEGWANMPNDIHNTRIETRIPAMTTRSAPSSSTAMVPTA